ncbi:MAG: O-antigen ligase family protein [Bacilli bacterium]|nr:O-antigen ligase family protein [Bacilli bacterium]
MGKLKFTLSNIWFWVALIAVSFLTENLSLLTTNFKQGFNAATLGILSAGCLLCLFLYYFINHKENKIKLDYVLLPGIAIVGLSLLLGIWLQQTSVVPYADGSDSITVSFSNYEKIRASIILVLFLGVAYAFTFMMNVNRPGHRIIMLMACVGIGAAVVSVIYSLATEMNVYIAIFKGDEVRNLSIDSFYGNKNYYGGILFIGILTCFIANYYRPRLHWYILICALYVILVSTAAVLPSLICTIAVPVYLLEEIVRFGLKHKWKYFVFAIIALMLLFALIILFYWGTTHSWKGFIGLDTYISQTFQAKDFLTYSGRTQIWQTVIPLCFDSPIHMIFGHGFMLSEKLLVAVTGAMYNRADGVKTTHNGYLEIMFDYGAIGLIVHVLLVCYFIYCAIRLLMEKRIHFVFVYSFVVLCCAAFNFCESSSFFDIGVKEIYMTMVFMMPVIAEYKMSRHPEKIEELKNLPVERKTMKPVRVGQWIALIMMSFLIVAVASLTFTTVYTVPFVKNLILNIVIGLAISILFIPYLVTLYFKGDKMNFIVHAVFNGLLIPAFMVVLYILLRGEASTKAMIPYLLPGLYVLILTLEVVSYSLIKNGSFKEWKNVVLKGCFSINRYALVGGFLFTLIPGLILETMGYMNFYIYIVCVIIGLIGYYAVFHFLPTKDGKELLNDANELAVWNIKRIALKDEKYYG